MIDVAAMQKRIDDLEFQNDELRVALFGGPFQVPKEFGLTRDEAKVLRVLVKHEEASRDMIMAALGAADGRVFRNPKICDVHICHIRRKCAPFGVDIKTIWGEGWSLDKEWRNRIIGGAA